MKGIRFIGVAGLTVSLAVYMIGCGGGGTTTITDTTAPVNAPIPINFGASSTSKTAVALALTATDNVGVTGYYVSESPTPPSASAPGWTSVTSTASYSADVSFTLSSGDGTKTVYVWFKDAAGNVSAAASDTITLSTSAPIAIGTAAYELSLGAAFDGTNYLVSIGTSPTGSGWTTDAQGISQTGAKVGSLIQSGCSDGYPRVAFGGTSYLLIGGDCDSWSQDIWGRFVSTGGGMGTNFLIAPGLGPGEQDHAGVAYGGGNFLVVYYREVNPSTSDSVVYGRLVSPSGNVGNEITISTGYGDQGENNVAFDGTNFLVVWTDDSNDYEVKGRFVSPVGTLGTEFSINASTSPSDNPLTVAFDGTNYLVVWTDEVGGFGSGEWDVFGQRVDTSGNLVGGVINISTATGHQFYPRIAFDGANYLVTWTDMRNDANKNWTCDSGDGTCWDIYGQYISRSGTLVGSEFVINNDAGDQVGGVGGFNNGKYLVIVNDGVSTIPPGCTEGCDMLANDVYGVFVTP